MTERKLTLPTESIEVQQIDEGFRLVVHFGGGETAYIPIQPSTLDIAAALETAAGWDRYVPKQFAEDENNYVQMASESPESGTEGQP